MGVLKLGTPKYYFFKLSDERELPRELGLSSNISESFYSHSSSIISSINYCQSLIQTIIYSTHHSEVMKAGYAIKNLHSTRSRMDFLNTFNDVGNDFVLNTVFQYAKKLFVSVYGLRNSLAHDIWFFSPKYPDCLLLSSLDNDARLLFTSGKLKHIRGTTAEDIHKGIIDYIDNVKMIDMAGIANALSDIHLCNWILLQISLVIEENDPQQKDNLKKAFFIFRGVSHLFPESERQDGKVDWSGASSHSI